MSRVVQIRERETRRTELSSSAIGWLLNLSHIPWLTYHVIHRGQLSISQDRTQPTRTIISVDIPRPNHSLNPCDPLREVSPYGESRYFYTIYKPPRPKSYSDSIMHLSQPSLILAYHCDRTLDDVYFSALCSAFTMTLVSFSLIVRQTNTMFFPPKPTFVFAIMLAFPRLT